MKKYVNYLHMMVCLSLLFQNSMYGMFAHASSIFSKAYQKKASLAVTGTVGSLFAYGYKKKLESDEEEKRYKEWEDGVEKNYALTLARIKKKDEEYAKENAERVKKDAEKDRHCYEKQKDEKPIFQDIFAKMRPGNLQFRKDGTYRLKDQFDCQTPEELANLYLDKLQATQKANYGILPPTPEFILKQSKDIITKNNIQHTDGGYPEILKEVLEHAQKYHLDTDAIRFKIVENKGYASSLDTQYKHTVIEIDKDSWNRATEFKKASSLKHEERHILNGDVWLSYRTDMQKTKPLFHFGEYAADVGFLVEPNVPQKKEILRDTINHRKNANTGAIDKELRSDEDVEKAYQKKNYYWKEILKLPEDQLPFKKENIDQWDFEKHPADRKRAALLEHALYLSEKNEKQKFQVDLQKKIESKLPLSTSLWKFWSKKNI
ncbi:hypothetical protein IPH25_04440 [bacterium]|nr:MAG: hypothetical protein IPG37_01435 [bacterium]QQR61694.1 MAG: hypothetical protein IPH25_04440 [bacterium]